MILYYIYFGIILLGTVVGLIRFISLNTSSKFMLLVLLLTLVSEGLTTSYRFYGLNNVFIYHIFMPVEFILVGITYYMEIRNKWIIMVLILVILFEVFNSLFIQNYEMEFGTYAFIVQFIVSTFFNLWYLRKLLDEKKEVGFYAYPLFWMSLGFTIFNIINLFMLGTINTIAVKIPNIGLIFKNIRFFSNYLLYGFFILAFLSKQEYLKGRGKYVKL